MFEVVYVSRFDYATIFVDLGFVRREYINNMCCFGMGGMEVDLNSEIVCVIKGVFVVGFYFYVV